MADAFRLLAQAQSLDFLRVLRRLTLTQLLLKRRDLLAIFAMRTL